MSEITLSEDSSLVGSIVALIKANFLLVALAAILGRALVKRFASPLRNIPGPPLAASSRFWKGWSTCTTNRVELIYYEQCGARTLATPNSTISRSTRNTVQSSARHPTKSPSPRPTPQRISLLSAKVSTRPGSTQSSHQNTHQISSLKCENGSTHR